MPTPSTPTPRPSTTEQTKSVASISQHHRLKSIWCGRTEDDTAYWKDLFESPTPAPEIRRQLAAIFGIEFHFDHQLARFLRWERHWQKSFEETERLKDDDLFGKALNPDTSRPAVRDACLLQTYRRAQVTGDFALGLNAIRHDLDIDRATLDEQKFQYDAAAAALKAWAKIKPIAESDLNWYEKIQELRRTLFGSIPEDNPPATSPAAPSVQPPTSPSVTPAAPLKNLATTVAPPVTPQPVTKPPSIPSASGLGAQIAKDGFGQAARMCVAANSLKNFWSELVRDYVYGPEPLEAYQPYNLSVINTNKVRQDACALRDRILPLASAASAGQGAESWSPTLAQLAHVITAADTLLVTYKKMIVYITDNGTMCKFCPPTRVMAPDVVANIDHLAQATDKFSDIIQRKLLAQVPV